MAKRKSKSKYEQPKWAVQQLQRASGLIEDVCNCGVGHPNSQWMAKHDPDGDRGMGVHGCCGCCHSGKPFSVPEKKRYQPDICIVCHKQVESEEYWPHDALVFEATGNYGSRIFDPMTGQKRLRVVICDSCVLQNSDKVRMVVDTTKRTEEVGEFKIDEYS